MFTSSSAGSGTSNQKSISRIYGQSNDCPFLYTKKAVAITTAPRSVYSTFVPIILFSFPLALSARYDDVVGRTKLNASVTSSNVLS